MIHLIYIYFIVNAFLAGREKDWILSILCMLFGVPIFLFDGLIWLFVESWKYLNNNLLISGLYKLYFTDKLSNFHPEVIELRRKQYFGRIGTGKKNRKLNAYELFFLRQIDKKYNYGITRKEVQNDN